MRIELLEDVPGIGLKGEQAGVDDKTAMQLIVDRKAIDVASCADNAKKGVIAHPIWDAQDLAASGSQAVASDEWQEEEEATEKSASPARKK